MMESVKEDELCRMIDVMEDNSEIQGVYFKHSSPQTSTSDKYSGYIEMEHSKKYIINFQAALWRRNALRRIIPPGLTPWDIEEKSMYGDLKSNDVFLCPIKGTPDTYGYTDALKAPVRCFGNHQSRKRKSP